MTCQRAVNEPHSSNERVQSCVGRLPRRLPYKAGAVQSFLRAAPRQRRGLLTPERSRVNSAVLRTHLVGGAARSPLPRACRRRCVLARQRDLPRLHGPRRELHQSRDGHNWRPPASVLSLTLQSSSLSAPVERSRQAFSVLPFPSLTPHLCSHPSLSSSLPTSPCARCAFSLFFPQRRDRRRSCSSLRLLQDTRT